MGPLPLAAGKGWGRWAKIKIPRKRGKLLPFYVIQILGELSSHVQQEFDSLSSLGALAAMTNAVVLSGGQDVCKVACLLGRKRHDR